MQEPLIKIDSVEIHTLPPNTSDPPPLLNSPEAISATVLSSLVALFLFIVTLLTYLRRSIYPLSKRPLPFAILHLTVFCTISIFYAILSRGLSCTISRGAVYILYPAASVFLSTQQFAVFSLMLKTAVGVAVREDSVTYPLAAASGSRSNQLGNRSPARSTSSSASTSGNSPTSLLRRYSCLRSSKSLLIYSFASLFVLYAIVLVTAFVARDSLTLPDGTEDPDQYAFPNSILVSLVNVHCYYLADYVSVAISVLFVIPLMIWLRVSYGRVLPGEERKEGLGLLREAKIHAIMWPITFAGFLVLSRFTQLWCIVALASFVIAGIMQLVPLLQTFRSSVDTSEKKRLLKRRASEAASSTRSNADAARPVPAPNAVTNADLQHLIASSEAFRTAFASFLRYELSLENLLFIEMVTVHRSLLATKGTGHQDAWDSHDRIFNTFLTQDALLPLNLDYEMSLQLAGVAAEYYSLDSRLASMPPPGVFDEAMEQVTTLVRTDSYMRFARQHRGLVVTELAAVADMPAVATSPSVAGEVPLLEEVGALVQSNSVGEDSRFGGLSSQLSSNADLEGFELHEL